MGPNMIITMPDTEPPLLSELKIPRTLLKNGSLLFILHKKHGQFLKNRKNMC